jgi:hypothetical protein
VPDHVFVATEIPRTTSGKKAEIPVKRILQGNWTASTPNESVPMSADTFDYFRTVGAMLRREPTDLPDCARNRALDHRAE